MKTKSQILAELNRLMATKAFPSYGARKTVYVKVEMLLWVLGENPRQIIKVMEDKNYPIINEKNLHDTKMQKIKTLLAKMEEEE